MRWAGLHRSDASSPLISSCAERQSVSAVTHESEPPARCSPYVSFQRSHDSCWPTQNPLLPGLSATLCLTTIERETTQQVPLTSPGGWRIEMQILPSAYTLGWNKVGTNFISGGVKGYLGSQTSGGQS